MAIYGGTFNDYITMPRLQLNPLIAGMASVEAQRTLLQASAAIVAQMMTTKKQARRAKKIIDTWQELASMGRRNKRVLVMDSAADWQAVLGEAVNDQ